MEAALDRRTAPRSSQALAALAGAALVVALGLPSAGALALGVLVGVSLEGAGAGAPTWGASLGQRLLKLGVVGLGAGLDLGYVLRVGLDGLGSALVTLGLALAVGAWLTRRAGLERDLGALVTVGTAICGGSAIAAAAPALRARAEHVGAALAVVFALNALALVLFPVLGAWLGLDATQFGRWCALAIHDTSSVVGAAAAFGPEALELATVTKLGRALWIVPVVLGLSWIVRRRAGETGAGRVALPGFILAFVAAAALVTLVPALQPAGRHVAAGARVTLVVALYALGLGTRPAALRGLGPSALGVGAALWVTLSLASLGLVML